MSAAKSLPIRPSLASLRKQAKRLQRDVAAGDPDALARARSQLPAATTLTQRDAQWVLAREYGFSGWHELRAEVAQRTGHGLLWAVARAKRAIHDNDTEQLKQLLDAQPALVTARDASGTGLLTYAAEAFGCASDAQREQLFTRRASAELLLERGAEVTEELWQNVIVMRSKGMLQLLSSRSRQPRTLRLAAALGDSARVQELLPNAERAELHEACIDACAFGQAQLAATLLDHCIALDPALGQRIEAGPGRADLLAHFAEDGGGHGDLWQSYVTSQLRGTHDEALYAEWLTREPWVLSEAALALQVELIEQATYMGQRALIQLLLAAEPALLRQQPPPPSAAIEYAYEYGNASFVPLLARIWPVPDDLPHAAGAGDLARVQRWFDGSGRPALGDPAQHYPVNNPRKLGHLHWHSDALQHVLDTALAWACLNHHFEVADFLLAHGADIDTDWGTHEPASILHECALSANRSSAEYLIDRGIDLTIQDHRWSATAEDWARHAAHDEEMAAFLAAAKLS